MVLSQFEYFDHGNKKILEVKRVSIFSSGLMFRKQSPPLLFTLSKEKKYSITALFCKSFTAITLDKNKNLLKKININGGQRKIRCYGKYLMELP